MPENYPYSSSTQSGDPGQSAGVVASHTATAVGKQRLAQYPPDTLHNLPDTPPATCRDPPLGRTQNCRPPDESRRSPSPTLPSVRTTPVAHALACDAGECTPRSCRTCVIALREVGMKAPACFSASSRCKYYLMRSAPAVR